MPVGMRAAVIVCKGVPETRAIWPSCVEIDVGLATRCVLRAGLALTAKGACARMVIMVDCILTDDLGGGTAVWQRWTPPAIPSTRAKAGNPPKLFGSSSNSSSKTSSMQIPLTSDNAFSVELLLAQAYARQRPAEVYWYTLMCPAHEEGSAATRCMDSSVALGIDELERDMQTRRGTLSLQRCSSDSSQQSETSLLDSATSNADTFQEQLGNLKACLQLHNHQRLY